ncbi:MAG: hypothetical protein QM783_20360 [Phycisphaerales bacterium]
MSSTNGLSSNNARSQTNNPMTLDSQTRQNVQAQNEARVLQSIGVIKSDEYSSGGGLNPLKSLYSAAAATFLKNKRGTQTAEKQTNQGQDKSVTAVNTLSTSSGSSSISWQQNNSKVSGPGSSGAGFKKFATQGQNGPTGYDTPTTDPDAAAQQAAADAAAKAAADAAAKAAADAAAKAAADAAAKAAADAAAAAAANKPSTYTDSTELVNAFKDQVRSSGGVVSGRTTGGVTSISFEGMTGSVEQRSDELRVSLSYLGGSVSFRLDMSGSMNHYNENGITFLMRGKINDLKDSMSQLDRTHVDVVA